MIVVKIIGDVHGKLDEYLKIIEDADFSIQIGDFSLDRNEIERVFTTKIDYLRHKILPGNHDLHDSLHLYPHYIPITREIKVGPLNFFCVPGGYSIDRALRVHGESVFYNEELSFDQLFKSYLLYKQLKPDFVLSHEAPGDIPYKMGVKGAKLIADESFYVQSLTAQTLGKMWDFHKPADWIFGHWHIDRSKKIEGTKFRCLGELCVKTITVPDWVRT